jgi:transposase-like protein
MAAPVLAVGDGALGFWSAVREVFPETREQRCWWHKIGNVLNALLAFYDYPAEHWIHLRTTNPIESTFATVRLRQRVTKGPGSRAAVSRWRSSSSNQHRPGGGPSTHPTSSRWSVPARYSRAASSSNDPTNQRVVISKSRDTPILSPIALPARRRRACRLRDARIRSR